MQDTAKHYHGWVLRIAGTDVSLEAMPGEYSIEMTCRRHAIAKAGGAVSKVVVLVCRNEEICPSRIREAALTT